MFLDKSLDWLSPRECLCCKKRIKNGQVCKLCATPPPITSSENKCPICFSPLLDNSCTRCSKALYEKMRFIWCYEKSVRDCITAIKYQPNERLLRLLLNEVPKARIHLFPGRRWDLVVPIPSSIKSHWSRGFFTTKEIALSFVSSFPFQNRPHVNTKVLSLTRSHQPQASLTLEKRRSNMKNSLIASPEKISGKRVLLIDDVITTGATLEEGCRALKEAGATSIDIFALARADTWLRFHPSTSAR